MHAPVRLIAPLAAVALAAIVVVPRLTASPPPPVVSWPAATPSPAPSVAGLPAATPSPQPAQLLPSGPLGGFMEQLNSDTGALATGEKDLLDALGRALRDHIVEELNRATASR